MARKYRTTLIVDGDAKGGIRAVKATDAELKKLDRQQRRNTRTAAKHAERMQTLHSVGSRFAIGMTAAAAGIGLVTRNSIAATLEAESLARTLNVGTGQLQAWGYAGEQVGLSTEKIGDIFKDTADKIGDFAATGGGEAADIFENLNVSVRELQGLSPDKQLLRIAEAISEVDDRSQQVFYLESIADDASRLLPLLDDGAAKLKEFAQEARDFNIALGDEDVARLMEANRATARFSGAMRGLGNDIAIAVAPALTSAVDDMDYFRDIIGDAGFQQNIATLASAMARMAGFAAEGVREFVTFGQQIGNTAASLAGYSNELDDINAKVERLESMRNSSVLSRAGLFNFGDGFDTYLDDAEIDRHIARLRERRQEIAGEVFNGTGGQSETLDTIEIKPGRYDALVDQFDQRHAKLEKLRAARVKLQQAIKDDPANADAYRRSLAEVNRQMDGLSRSSRQGAKALTEQQRAAERLQSAYDSTAAQLSEQIALFDNTSAAARTRYEIEEGQLSGLSGTRQAHVLSLAQELDQMEAQRQAIEDQKSAVRSLFPEWERLRRARELTDSVAMLPDDQQAFGRRRAEQMVRESATEGLPGMNGLDAQYNGPFGEAERLGAERDDYQAQYERRLEAFREYARQHQDDAATAYAAIETLQNDHERRMTRYQEHEQRARRQGYASLFGDITSLTGSFVGEQSGIYQSLFAVSKGFAIADAIVQIQGGIAKAANMPFPANLGAMASVASQTVGIVSTMKNTSIAGQAHDGSSALPNDGTYYMQGGERVIDRRANQDFTRWLARQNNTNNNDNRRGGDVRIPVNITVEAKQGVSAEDARRQGEAMGRAFKESVERVMTDNMRPGGLLANVKRPM